MAKKSRASNKAARAANKADRRANSPRAQKTARRVSRQENRTARKIAKQDAKLRKAELRNERVEIRAESAESRNEALANFGIAAVEAGAGLVGFNNEKATKIGDLGIGSGSEIKDKVQDFLGDAKQEFDSLGQPTAGKDNKMIFVIIGAIVLFFVVKKK